MEKSSKRSQAGVLDKQKQTRIAEKFVNQGNFHTLVVIRQQQNPILLYVTRAECPKTLPEPNAPKHCQNRTLSIPT
ncbi:hypothetical protein AYI68_g5816 [Smittium mucronatum]|uniref:Uncharacterized protein n=1 Tax=Smittium mucronatum TaxID=133383 RepID=A0A1R0GT73_9FUNG|nr:hypothetical protein AYI68_g5816 [Smittium mucronatum]